MPRGHRKASPTTCRVSDLLNSIATFVQENPLWMEDDESTTRLGMAYATLTQMCKPDEVMDEEYEFIMNLHTALQERNQQ